MGLPVEPVPTVYDPKQSYCYRCFLDNLNSCKYLFNHCFVESIIKDFAPDENDLNTLHNVDERLFDKYRHWKYGQDTVYSADDVVGRYNDFTPLEIAPIAYEQYKGFFTFPLPFLRYILCDGLFSDRYCYLYDAR